MTVTLLVGALPLVQAEPYIVIYKGKKTREQTERQLHGRGLAMREHLNVIRGAAVELSGQEKESLSQDPEVEGIFPDLDVHGAAVQVTPSVAVGTASLNASGLTGQGIGVAVLDSGVRDRADLKARIVYSQDFTGTNKPLDDKYGHGTHVAGIVGGDGNSNPSNVGVAPRVSIVNLQVLDANGVGRDSWVIAAIDRAIALRTTYNIRVLNLSLGRPITTSFKTDPLCLAVKKAWQSGLVVVVAAGNFGRDNSFDNRGYGTITSPGNSPYVITVGATKTELAGAPSKDELTSYSSRGPSLVDRIAKPDLVAPGNLIVSLTHATAVVANTYPQIKLDASYARLSGTSMASGVVSGVVALMLQRDPTLTPDQVKARLMKTASKTFPASSVTTDALNGKQYTIRYDLFTVGAGMVNVNAALASTERAVGSAASPGVRFDQATGKVVLVTDSTGATNVVWGSSAFAPAGVWSANIVWGSNVVWGTNIVWGSNVVWGASAPAGLNIIWGSASPWGSSANWSQSSLSLQSLNALIYGDQ